MPTEALVLEGSWEEIRTHESELTGRRVRLVVLAPDTESPAPEGSAAYRAATGPSTAHSILQHAGTWAGDDLQERLAEVYATRSKAEF